MRRSMLFLPGNTPNIIVNGDAEDVLMLDACMAEMEKRHGLSAGSVKRIPLIETARGLENAYTVASASPRVAAIFLGAKDLTADLRSRHLKKTDEEAIKDSKKLTSAFGN